MQGATCQNRLQAETVDCQKAGTDGSGKIKFPESSPLQKGLPFTAIESEDMSLLISRMPDLYLVQTHPYLNTSAALAPRTFAPSTRSAVGHRHQIPPVYARAAGVVMAWRPKDPGLDLCMRDLSDP
jgi:hypothetical protein